jgi:hypothetical protein
MKVTSNFILSRCRVYSFFLAYPTLLVFFFLLIFVIQDTKYKSNIIDISLGAGAVKN